MKPHNARTLKLVHRRFFGWSICSTVRWNKKVIFDKLLHKRNLPTRVNGPAFEIKEERQREKKMREKQTDGQKKKDREITEEDRKSNRD